MAKQSYALFVSTLVLLMLHYYFVASLAASKKNITTDEVALLSFKSSIINSDSYLNNWRTSSSLCSWDGVSCDTLHKRVYALDLSNMGLGGTISPHLGNLSFLLDLDLQGNSFHGQIPQELTQLHRLKFLDLSYNNLTGIIPQSISKLSKLEYLDISRNSLSGTIPQTISSFSSLRLIDLSHNLLTGNILAPPIFNNSALQFISLSYNYNLFGNLPSNICQGLPIIEFLYLSNNNISGDMPTVWHQCQELEQLDLSFNAFNNRRMPDDIANLTKLQRLYLDSNNLEGTILRSIGNCTLLKTISLNDNYFTGSIPEEIGYLDQLEVLAMERNNLSGPIASKLFNISTLLDLYLANNYFSGNLPPIMGRGLSNLEHLQLSSNMFSGKIPNGIANASKLKELNLAANGLSGTIPNIFGSLTALEDLILEFNNLTVDVDSLKFNFFTSLAESRNLNRLSIAGNSLSKLPKSIANLSLVNFWADSCGIGGNIPLEIGNMTNLVRLSLTGNHLNGTIPYTIKGLQQLQHLALMDNRLQGLITDELCEIRSLSELYLSNNNFSGAMPICLGNMTLLRKLDISSNRLISQIPAYFWSLKDILQLNLSFNALTGNLSPEVTTLRAIISLDLSSNQISSTIPTTIGSLVTLETFSLARNNFNGSIPTSLAKMVNLQFLDLSQNLLNGLIPKSLESLVHLEYINFSYKSLQGEIPNGGPFKNFTAQSFMHNQALCGKPLPPCVTTRSTAKMILIKCILPIIVSTILVVACIVLVRSKKKGLQTQVETNLSTLGVPTRISYYELVHATNGFNESNLLGKGSFGSVYRGMLSSGKMVAVKVLDMNMEATSKSFDAECNAMRNLRHRNLVEIICSCSNVDFKSLVMEFMSNGSVDKWLYSDNCSLVFMERLNIMIDVASALEYLHHGSSIPVVHCDLKPSNVLLDENMVAHVSDFGISKLLDEGQSKTHTQTLATLGYVAPEFGSKGIVSVKGDVYSYGIMLMEIFTGRRPTDDMFAGDLSLKTWISESIPNSVMEVVDSSLIQQHGESIDDILVHISSIFGLALSCCADSPEARINMTDLTASLIKIKTLYIQN